MGGKHYSSVAVACITIKMIVCQQVPNGMMGGNNGMMGGNNGMVPMANGQNPHMPGMVPIMQSPQLPNMQGSCASLLFDVCAAGKYCTTHVNGGAYSTKKSKDAQSHNKVTEQCCTLSTIFRGGDHNQHHIIRLFGCLTRSSLLSKFLRPLHSHVLLAAKLSPKVDRATAAPGNKHQAEGAFHYFCQACVSPEAAQQRRRSYQTGGCLCCRQWHGAREQHEHEQWQQHDQCGAQWVCQPVHNWGERHSSAPRAAILRLARCCWPPGSVRPQPPCRQVRFWGPARPCVPGQAAPKEAGVHPQAAAVVAVPQALCQVSVP